MPGSSCRMALGYQHIAQVRQLEVMPLRGLLQGPKKRLLKFLFPERLLQNSALPILIRDRLCSITGCKQEGHLTEFERIRDRITCLPLQVHVENSNIEYSCPDGCDCCFNTGSDLNDMTAHLLE